MPANTVLDSIVVFQGLAASRSTPLVITKTVVTGSATGDVVNGLEVGSMVVFYNRFVPPPPPSVDGRMTGGHLLNGTIVRTTLELVNHEIGGVRMLRKPDTTTGYEELVPEPIAP